VKIAIVVVLILNLNGEVQHKTTIADECPDVAVIANELEDMKVKKMIKDYGAVCLPAQFNYVEGIPL
jgi:hypothetical protein